MRLRFKYQKFQEDAAAIHIGLIINGCIDKKYALTDKDYEVKANNDIKVAEEVADLIRFRI